MKTLRVHLAAERHSVRYRLALLAKVCNAVAAGHVAHMVCGSLSLDTITIEATPGEELISVNELTPCPAPRHADPRGGIAILDVRRAVDVVHLGRLVAEVLGADASDAVQQLVERTRAGASQRFRTAAELGAALTEALVMDSVSSPDAAFHHRGTEQVGDEMVARWSLA